MVRYPALIACSSVVIVGKKRDTWQKIIMSAMVRASTMELMESVIGGGVSSVYNLLSCLVSCIINFLLKNM